MTSRDPTQPLTPRLANDGDPFAFDLGRTKPGVGHYGKTDVLERQSDRSPIDMEPMNWPLTHDMVRGVGPGCRPVPPHLAVVFRDVFGQERVDTGRCVLCFHPILNRWVVAERRYKDAESGWMYQTIWICSTFQTQDLPEDYEPSDWRAEVDEIRHAFAMGGLHGQVGEYREPDRDDFETVLEWGSTRVNRDLELKHHQREQAELKAWESERDAMMHDLITYQDRNIRNWMNDGIITTLNMTDVRLAAYRNVHDVEEAYDGRNPLKWKLIQHETFKEFHRRPEHEIRQIYASIREAEEAAAARRARADLNRLLMSRPRTEAQLEQRERFVAEAVTEASPNQPTTPSEQTKQKVVDLLSALSRSGG